MIRTVGRVDLVDANCSCSKYVNEIRSVSAKRVTMKGNVMRDVPVVCRDTKASWKRDEIIDAPTSVHCFSRDVTLSIELLYLVRGSERRRSIFLEFIEPTPTFVPSSFRNTYL